MSEEIDNQTLSKISSYVNQVGGKVVDQQDLEVDEDEKVAIFLCLHGSQRYLITESQNHPYFEIEYTYNLIERLAAELDEEDIVELIGEELDEDYEYHPATGDTLQDIHDGEMEGEIMLARDGDDLPKEMIAAKKVLESVDEDVMNRFLFNLFQELSNPMTSTQINYTENDAFREFRVSRKIFPEDEGFSLTEFNQTVQAVMSVGTFGANIIASTLDFTALETEEGSIEIDL